MIAKELGWYEALYTRWMNPENGYSIQVAENMKNMEMQHFGLH